MKIADRLIEIIAPETASRLEKQEMARRQPFQPQIVTGDYPGRRGDSVNPSRNGAQPGDTEIVGGIFPSRNGDPKQP